VVKEKRSFQEIAAVAEPIVSEAATSVKSLRASLEEIKNYDGVIGYILRNSTSAAIDLRDPTKIIDYAILSSSAHEASEKLSELFDLGDVRYITVEGKVAKVLSLMTGENKISVFIEKEADSEKVLRKLRLL
jgi:predicted regulator of Ras-like GTPase activity (Roadblock/LC7/MglB family)